MSTVSLARFSPSRFWPFEGGMERGVYLVRHNPGITGGLSYVLTGDIAERHPDFVGVLKVRRTREVIRAAAVMVEKVEAATLEQMAQHIAENSRLPVQLEVVEVPL